MAAKYKRILLKISGEFLAGENSRIDVKVLNRIASEIKSISALGVEVAIMVGGGNFFRGMDVVGLERNTADHLGLLATVMNALSLQNVLEQKGLDVRVMSAVPMDTFCEKLLIRRALRHLEKGRILIFAAGLGVPYFTTDTASVVRASEMKCDVLLKGTKVDGVYDMDPKKFLDAKKFESISCLEVLQKQLMIMDLSAISLSLTNKLPVIVFSIETEGNLKKIIEGSADCTIITCD